MLDSLNRCTIGIRIPTEVQAAVVEAQNTIRRRAGGDLVRWTPGTELMLSLASLGEISVQQVAQVQLGIRPVFSKYNQFDLILEGVGGHPSTLQPRMVWIGLNGDVPILEQMGTELDRILSTILGNQEGKSSRNHLPIGRLKQESEQTRSSLGRALKVAGIGHIMNLHVSQIELVRNSVTTAGPTWVTVEAYPLS